MKYLIISEYARCGKDYLAEELSNQLGLTFTSSSMFAAKLFIFDHFNGDIGLPSYESIEECYRDRVNYRQIWHDLIAEYNRFNYTRLATELYKQYDVYVGMRSVVELIATIKKHNPIVIYINAGDRLLPELGSNKLDETICRAACDYEIDNSKSLQEFNNKINELCIQLKMLKKD